MSGFEYQGSDGRSELRVRTYNRPATDAPLVAVGDAVIINGTASATGVPQVVAIAADTSTKITGIVVGIKPDIANESLSAVGVPASTAADLFVCDDSRAMYEVECLTTAAITDVGMNVAIDYVATSASGNIYTSNITIDPATAAVTATLPFQIVHLLEGKTSGTLGDRALVRLNASTVAPRKGPPPATPEKEGETDIVPQPRSLF